MDTKLHKTDIKRKTTRRKKYAKNMQRQRELIDRLDLYHGDYRNNDDIKKMCINYDLFNGRLDMALYDDDVCFNIGNEEVKIKHSTISHYPLISQIANAMYGEIMTRPFKPKAKHTGSSYKSARKHKYNELIAQLLDNEVVQPIRSEVERALMTQLQEQDPSQLTPDIMEQIQAQIEQETQTQTPEEIVDFMENDFQTPTQRQAQQLLDYFLCKEEIDLLQKEGFKHAIITGKEFYHITDRHGEPKIELINPKQITWSASQNVEWVQDADWAKTEQWISLERAMQKYAEVLSKKNHKELDGFCEPIGGISNVGDPEKDQTMQDTMKMISYDSDRLIQEYGKVDIKTKDGQNKMKHIYADAIARHGGTHGNNFSSYGVRETYFTWRDKTKMYRVTRMMEGKEQKFWFAEHYEPTHDDLEVKEVWVDEIWEGTKLSTVQPIYVNIRRVPAQYKSIYDPFDSKLPIVGRCYNTHMNNAKNIAPIDLGKPWQKEFDTLMAQIKHDMATDVGRVMLLLMNMKPDGMKWQDWMDTMRNAKLLLAAPQKHGLSGVDPQMMRSIDLSRTADIVAKLQLLESIKSNLTQAMFFNPARMGAIGQYATNENVQQNQVASYNQTEGFFETHRVIVEKALNMFMNRAKYLYKDKDWKLESILDDVSRVDLMLGSNFWYEELNIQFSTTTEDIRRVEKLRDNMLAFTQNGMGFEGVLGLTLADTPSEIADIMRREQKKIDTRRQEEMAAQQQAQSAALEQEAALKQAEMDMKKQLEQDKLRSQERRTAVQAEQLRLANDTDQNKTPDSVQRELVKQEFEAQKQEREIAFKREMADLDNRTKLELKEKEQDIRRSLKDKLR